MSARAIASLEARVRQAVSERPCELVAFESGDERADIAFISRDVTGLSTKHEITEETERCYELLRRSPRLVWVQSHAAGIDRPILVELRERGVTVVSASGTNASVVAQSALAGLLALARHLPQLMAAQRERRWAPLIRTGMPRDLEGQTAVIVGWGPVARDLGRMLQAIGLALIVVRQSDAPAGPGIETVRFDHWRTVLPRADWLVLACPLNEQTRGRVDAAALSLLPRGARLINVARGEVVVEADLIAALSSGRLAGAHLDVFEHEPLPASSPLWTMPNVIATPHSAGHADGNEARVAMRFIENLRRWCGGEGLISATR
jgi:phosphoglycerate dehydrogenase-like enzyme